MSGDTESDSSGDIARLGSVDSKSPSLVGEGLITMHTSSHDSYVLIQARIVLWKLSKKLLVVNSVKRSASPSNVAITSVALTI